MFSLFKKTIAVCLIGFGLGLLCVIFLPFVGWLFLVRNSTNMCRYRLAYLLKR
ncbi:MAG: hypothetical protein FWC68_02265 [Oscillospiraceae bacterium]|nr:hypothetical protein [Oscillospiraceae bacterium]